jgi:paraquat-inducible protein A
MRERPEQLLAAGATLVFPVALLLPLFTFSPSLGDPLLDGVVEYAEPGALDASSYSVVGGIVRLFDDGDPVIAIVLLLFSVFFPAVKLSLLWGIMIRPAPSHDALVRRLETLGPWSMADVFVVSIMLLAFKSFPGGTRFTVGLGYYLFLASVVLSLSASWLVAKRLPGRSLLPSVTP